MREGVRHGGFVIASATRLNGHNVLSHRSLIPVSQAAVSLPDKASFYSGQRGALSTSGLRILSKESSVGQSLIRVSGNVVIKVISFVELGWSVGGAFT